MSRDPEQKFVRAVFHRHQIAEDLNYELEGIKENAGTEADAKVTIVGDLLAPDDDRLTDEICQEYADRLQDLSDDFPSEDRYLEAASEILLDLLRDLKIVQ